MRNLGHIIILSIVFVICNPFIGYSQTKTYSAKEALALFKEGNYTEAEVAYEQILQRYDREAKYNYYYGICLIQNNNDLSQAVKRLKYAALKGVSRDAYYYLGRAYQLTYRFDDAINQYNRFLKYASSSDIRNDKAELYIAQSEVGRQHSAKIYHFDVYSRDTVNNDAILTAYNPAKDVGKVVHNEAFFESGVDPKGVLYLTERGDEVYFSKGNELNGHDLYKMEKLLDGWSENMALDGVNSEYSDRYPFVVIDGSTIYFSSDRPGGLGGYDLYKAQYDSERKAFSDPVNLGIPFNSPKDDYLFVVDEFNQLAWFTSNRETNDSTAIVYTLKWDDSVVKNLVTDMNDVNTQAAMYLSGKQLTAEQANAIGGSVKNEQKAKFHFMVADTLEYSQFEHFKSDEARRLFEEGMNLSMRKDSLSGLMREKRQQYARTNSETQQSMLVNDILSMEKKVYGLDEKIERSFYHARSVEQAKIKELVAAGTYTSNSQVKIEKNNKSSFEDILIPDNFIFHTDEEFAAHLAELEVMYQKVFESHEIDKLHHADSLYVWGNILTLEASKMLEEANSAPEETESIINAVIRKKDSVDEESLTAQHVAQSKELKLTALKLYHESLNRKFEIYEERLKQVVIGHPTRDLEALDQARAESKEYFRKAMDMIDPINGFDMDRYERSGAIKRSGVKVQEAGLVQYAETIGENESVESEVKSTVPKTYQELQGFEAVEEKSPKELVEDAFKTKATKQLVYKIQIGVFKNEPNAGAVAKIPEVSKVEIPDRGLTKYFSGKYKSYAEAQKDLQRVQSAGFSGAFVVVFENGQQINLTDELKK